VRASSCSERCRLGAAAALALSTLAPPCLGQTASPECVRTAELETELAKRPALYLALDIDALRLEVKVRGTTLSEVPVLDLSRLVFSGLLEPGRSPTLTAPAVWTVVEGPGDTDRETIAPTTLRPYSEDEEESAASPAATKPKGEAEKPATYRVQLDVGWQLYLVNEPPRLGWFRRFGAAIRDGWQRLQGEEPAHPPLVTLVVAPADAQRLHHLFRTGMPILVTRGGC
jgi:hypothetical protein